MSTYTLQPSTTIVSPPNVAQESCCHECCTMSQVVDMNNIGVSHFQQSDFADAFRCFHQTLLLIHSKMSRRGSTRPHLPSKTLESQDEAQRSKALNAMLRCHGTAGTVARGTQEHSFTIHDEPFQLPTMDSQLIASHEQEEWVSAVVIFNCALACHMQGLLKEDCNSIQRQKYLEKARGLYRQALALLQQYINLQKTTGNIMVDLLCVAALNNAALVTMCDLGDYESPDPRGFLSLLISRAHAFKEIYCRSSDEDTRHGQNTKDGDSDVRLEILCRHVGDLVLNAVGLLFAGPPCASAA